MNLKWYPYGTSWYYGPHLEPRNAVVSVRPEWESHDPDKGVGRPARYVIRVGDARKDTRNTLGEAMVRANQLLRECK